MGLFTKLDLVVKDTAGASPYGEGQGMKVCNPFGCHWVGSPMSWGRPVMGEAEEEEEAEERGVPQMLIARFV
eukprot:CAMPEP_0181323056 /NCGR_PEP_ID=MMETSP1101-20121128/19571_1 /TAXON_ID=46948 /ORGANISM="Rhodomonas abbreviata, Strain Caron Lab Isolate" /LENGTH=71 /DNA_ID=CAMNT_0023431037 /DNA_START=12 /DNA_END=227 /DNA_ORIENTATION=+